MATFTGTFKPDSGSIKNVHISNQAADIIDCAKVQPFADPWTNFGLAIADAPATKEVVVYVAEGNEVINGFHTLLTAGASTNITFDLKKNGSSILTGVITYNAAGTREVKDGTLSSNTLVDGDVLSMAMTVSVATGASAPRAWANIVKASVPS